MNNRPLSIYLGREAARRIARHGWSGREITLLLGASGGPKWLILGALDRLLFGDFLMEKREAPLQAVGSSIGSWRHACLAQPDPVDALDRFEDIYVNWDYSEKPDPREISDASLSMLEHMFGNGGADALIDHRLLHSYIVTARGRGLNSARNTLALGLGMGSAAIGNAIHRRLLALHFQRVLFTSLDAPPLNLNDFGVSPAPLRPDTVAQALHASGSIPFLLAGERDIPNAPPGHYWDGGIIDYHFDLAGFEAQQLILYPHFRKDLTTGWFDKFLPWRRQRKPNAENVILLCPSDDFIASLPGGKIPDRSDFTRMPPEERIRYWRTCIERSRELAEDFQRQLDSPDPLADTQLLS
ncbi:patatin-like phospholipase family protein [Congregibacter litoralis]|uniref:Patatin-like phospholipase n=1 Tax=Congregibacter litoralis KT71 TaxID=314285 RepID=A4A9K8_9GAMM|nr:patatin-like phospholipase family protein [Congregibacter litoralis]EAQ97175.1 Patatin-like phospholipase [Congregibacter litoralis KT71]